MTTEPRLDIIGAALADPSRVRILCELMDGRAFTNKELACAAGISPQTASAHLKRLEETGLTSCLRSGRSVYHRIANEEVAEVLEAMGRLSPTDHLKRAHRRLPEENAMQARSCYNHIAGRLGVLILDRLIAVNALRQDGEALNLNTKADVFFAGLDLDLSPFRLTTKPPAKTCLDWTERRHHMAGPLATALMTRCFEAGWLQRQTGSRSLIVSASGRAIFEQKFGLSFDLISEVANP